MVRLERVDETWVKIICDAGILEELYYEFQFEVTGAKYHPKVKAGIWDGKLKLVGKNRRTYIGLHDSIRDFCASRDYAFESDCDIKSDVTPKEVGDFVGTLKLPHNVRDYQYMAIYKMLKNMHTIVQSPTGSGKSLIIYAVIRYLLDADEDNRILLVVPTISLVNQMASDFHEYAEQLGFDIDDHVHKIYGGQEKLTDKRIVISTWQSIYKGDKEWFEPFNAVIVDEVHLARATSLSGILEKCSSSSYKLGLTGSLDKSLTNRMMLTALFGKPYKVATTRNLIDKGHLSDINIKCVVFDYAKEYQKAYGKTLYKKEIDFIVQYEPRNMFIRNLTLSCEGVTLVLFNYIEKHGELLHTMLQEKAGERKVHYVHGGTDAEDRETIRQIINSAHDDIILASLGTFSTGINAPKIRNIIAAHPTKSIIRVLQSIGRGLRKSEGKDSMTWFDLSDRLTSGKTKNHTYKHFTERLDIYNSEEFEYSITEVLLKDEQRPSATSLC